MFCTRCGAVVPEGSKYCNQCGCSVQREEAPKPQMAKKKWKFDLPKKKPSQKQLKIIGIAAAVLLAVALVVWLATRPPKISVPDLEQFMGVSAAKNKVYSGLKYSFPVPDGEEETYLRKIDAYAKLLNSSEYPYMLDSSEEAEGPDNVYFYTYDIEYVGPKADSTNNGDIYIQFAVRTDGAYPSELDIYFSKEYRFVFVPVEGYGGVSSTSTLQESVEKDEEASAPSTLQEPVKEAEKPSFPITLQSPVEYLGRRDQEGTVRYDKRDSGTIRWDYTLFIPYEESLALLKAYIEDHLLDEVGLVSDGVDDSREGSYRAFFTYPEAEGYVTSSGNLETCCVMVACADSGDDTSLFTLVYSPSFAMAKNAPLQEDPEDDKQNSAPAQTTTKPAKADPAVLPDFLETGKDFYLHENSTVNKWIYRVKHTDTNAAMTYIGWLKDLGYTVVHTEDESTSVGLILRWEFAHSGLNAATISDHGAHVKVKCNTLNFANSQEVSITFSPDLSMSGEGPTGGGSSSSGSSSSSDDFFDSSSSGSSGRQRCTFCDGGEVECNDCWGEGGKEVYDNSTPNYSGGYMDRTHWATCSSCGGDGEKTCDRCGGDGWR